MKAKLKISKASSNKTGGHQKTDNTQNVILDTVTSLNTDRLKGKRVWHWYLNIDILLREEKSEKEQKYVELDEVEFREEERAQLEVKKVFQI